MKLYPAIDLKNNQCIRLSQGKFDTVKVYDKDPIAVAKRWIDAGATYLHVIDLDGAEKNTMLNLPSIKRLIKLGKPLQVGGGIRSLKKAQLLLAAGVSRIIVGTIAIKDRALLEKLITLYPGQIVVSIDVYKGIVTTHGWQNKEKQSALSLALELEKCGIKTIIYTDIEKDGMLSGPTFEAYQMLKSNTHLEVIAAGGVSSIDDIKQLVSIGVDGAIIGKALYEEKLSLKEAIACLRKE